MLAPSNLLKILIRAAVSHSPQQPFQFEAAVSVPYQADRSQPRRKSLALLNPKLSPEVRSCILAHPHLIQRRGICPCVVAR